MKTFPTFILHKIILTSVCAMVLALLTACGRQSEPTPQTPDHYPRSYPKP